MPAQHDQRVGTSVGGTQFGADDLQKTYAELRAEWVKNGAQWWSETQRPPDDWSAEKQLAAAFNEEDP